VGIPFYFSTKPLVGLYKESSKECARVFLCTYVNDKAETEKPVKE